MNKADHRFPVRKRTRLVNYDYSSGGAYFLTLCSENKADIFGKIIRESLYVKPYIKLSEYGEILEKQISEINRVYKDIEIIQYIIMPNHLHLIVLINDDELIKCGASGTPPPTNARIPLFVSALKRFTNRKAGIQLWQRGYYDHIIRDEDDFLRIQKYIDENHYGKL